MDSFDSHVSILIFLKSQCENFCEMFDESFIPKQVVEKIFQKH